MRKEILREINGILINISSALGAERSTVFLINEEKAMLESLISQGVRNNLISMPMNCGIAGHVATNGESQIVNNVTTSTIFNPYFDGVTGYKTEKVICVPIENEMGQVIGVIQSLNKKEMDFLEKDLKILKVFADTIALALKNAKLYSSAEAIKNDIATLLKVSSSINSELDLSKLIKLIIQKTSEITHSDRSSFFLYNEEEEVLWTKYGEGLGKQIIKTKKGLASFVARSKKPLIENSAYDNPHFDPSIDEKIGYKTNTIISVPVFNSSRKLIGVIQSMNKKNGDFTNQDLFILNGFASQISIAIQNSTLFEEINNIKNYLDVLFENLDNGILTIDKDGMIKTVNKRFCDIIGTNQKELIGRYYKDLESRHFSFLDYSDYTFMSGEKFEKFNIEGVDASNNKLVFNFNSLPMKNQKGDNLGVINVIKDITSEERVRGNLSRYLPQHVINEIISKDDLSLFNGKYRECTILFSDIRNFTSLTEQLEAKDTVNFLNNYFDVMLDSILKNNGVLDKLIGDAIMATFGIPYVSNNDAKNGLNTALEMIDNLKKVVKLKEISHDLDIGIGIATGNVISGNIGATNRFEYTVIGDSVNLASRLESLTKVYGVKVLLCETTYQKIAEDFICREIDCIRVKGKQKPVTIYTILRRNNQPLSKREQLFLELYSVGLKYYRQQDFSEARSYFSRVSMFNSKDKPARILYDRCTDFIINPPAENWSGTWAFSKK
jgi:adenylate cyclase